MSADADGGLWIASVAETSIGCEGGSRVVWHFEIVGGPFRPDDDPRPTRQADPRKAVRQTVSAFAMEAA